MLRELMEQTIGAVDDIKAVEPFERSARVEVRFSKINSAMRAVTDLQGLKFFDRPLMLAFSRGGASESPEKVQPTPPAASAASAAQWREREEQTPLTTDEEDQVAAALLHCVLLSAAFPTRCDQDSPLKAADYRFLSPEPTSAFVLTSFAAESAQTQ
jgi:hypothetical protein